MDLPAGVLDRWLREKMGLAPDAALTPELIRDYQFQKLTSVLAYVVQASPFYRRHLGGYPLHGLDSLAGLARLPFTTGDDLKNHGLQMLCVSQSEINRVVTLESSGTTGSPKRLYFTPADQALTIEYFNRGMASITLPGDKVLILLPGERPGSVGDMLALALEKLGLQPIKYGPGHTLADTLAQLVATQARVIVGIPVHLLALAKYYEQLAEKPPLRLQRMLLSTDYIAQTVVDEIKRVFDCQVFRYLGMTEMGWGGGIECPVHRGYHLYEGDFLFEIVDPATGRVLPAGEYGELVLTTLTRRGMPLVRYRTGDMTRLLPGLCSCGSALSRLGRVWARKKDIFPVDEDEPCGDSFSIGDLDEILPGLPGVVDFTATLSSRPGLPALHIEVVTIAATLNTAHLKNALGSQRVFRRLLKQDRLRLTIKTITHPGHYRPRLGKRRIRAESTSTAKG